MNTPEIERILNAAPRFQPPAGLKDRLVTNIRLAPAKDDALARPAMTWSPAWFRLWWPAVGSLALCLACGALLAVQQAQIQKLKESLRELSHSDPDPLPVQPAAVPAAAPNHEQGELDRLKNEAALLSSQVSRLESVQAENQKLRQQLAAPVTGSFTAEEEQAMEEARQKALQIRCVNNLKQLCLAARVWGLDNADSYPSNLILMTNEMNTPKILLCPADTNRQTALDWATFTTANCSYDYVAPGGSPNEPYRILFRCPIHGNVGLCDGSVHSEVTTKHPEWIVPKDGKLFLDRNAPNKP